MSGKKTIVTLLRVSLLACPLLFTTPSFAMIDTPSVKVGFSPEGSASALVLDTINSAESSIRMMAYSFTDPDVMHALAKAKKRGVDVRIVVDDKGNTNGFAPIFPDTCYHLTHYWPAAADIPVASDNPVHYADAIRYNARTPLQGSLLPLTRLV